MTMRFAFAAIPAVVAALAAVVATTPRSAGAVALDECETQRARYPKVWNDASADRVVHHCRSHYAGLLAVALGASDAEGRRLMTLVPLRRGDGDATLPDPDRTVRRIWLDADQARRLEEGRYFATVVRSEDSCWIRGDLSGDAVFFIDAAAPAPDGPDAGAFYNKAPRVGAFDGQAWECEPAK